MSCSAQERLAALRQEHAAEEVRECSFAPTINIRSARLMSDRSAVLKVRTRHKSV